MATVLFVYVRNKAISPKNLGMKLSEFPSQPLDQATEMHEKLTSSFTLFVVIFVHRLLIQNHPFTMLHKFSKCEVKAALCGNTIFLPLKFYVKSNFGKIEISKMPFF